VHPVGSYCIHVTVLIITTCKLMRKSFIKLLLIANLQKTNPCRTLRQCEFSISGILWNWVSTYNISRI